MLLPRKIDIDRAKAIERKRDIDEGMKLARAVDDMRALKVEQEEAVKRWREVTIATLHADIKVFADQRDAAEREAIEARRVRDELRQPLDEAWYELRVAQETVAHNKQELFLDTERFAKRVEELDRREAALERQARALHASNSRNHEETARAKKRRAEAELLRKQALALLTDAERSCALRAQALSDEEEAYRVALKTLSLREQAADERDADLIIRERDLARRIENLRRVDTVTK